MINSFPRPQSRNVLTLLASPIFCAQRIVCLWLCLTHCSCLSLLNTSSTTTALTDKLLKTSLFVFSLSGAAAQYIAYLVWFHKYDNFCILLRKSENFIIREFPLKIYYVPVFDKFFSYQQNQTLLHDIRYLLIS